MYNYHYKFKLILFNYRQICLQQKHNPKRKGKVYILKIQCIISLVPILQTHQMKRESGDFSYILSLVRNMALVLIKFNMQLSRV